MIEAMLIKPLGTMLLIMLPAKIILHFSPPWLRTILEFEIWADPDR